MGSHDNLLKKRDGMSWYGDRPCAEWLDDVVYFITFVILNVFICVKIMQCLIVWLITLSYLLLAPIWFTLTEMTCHCEWGQGCMLQLVRRYRPYYRKALIHHGLKNICELCILFVSVIYIQYNYSGVLLQLALYKICSIHNSVLQ